MQRLYFSDRHKRLTDVLFRAKNEEKENPYRLFQQLSDLMLFSAMVGKYSNKRSKLDGTTGGECQSDAFRKNEDGLVFLISLLENDDPKSFKDDAEYSWQTLQEYSVGGMDVIEEWLAGLQENEFQEKLLEKIREVAMKRAKKGPQVVVKKPKKILFS